MNPSKNLFAVAALSLTLGASAYALSPETKDKINDAVKPVQRGVTGAVDRLQNALASDKASFQTQSQDALNESDALLSKLQQGAPPGTTMNVEQLTQGLRTSSADLRDKIAALNNATEQDYSARYQDSRGALDRLQRANFGAAGWYQDARADEEKNASDSVSALSQRADALQQRLTNAPGSQAMIQSAIQDLRNAQSDASKKIQQLRGSDPQTWSNLRNDIYRIVQNAEDNYRQTISRLGTS